MPKYIANPLPYGWMHTTQVRFKFIQEKDQV